MAIVNVGINLLVKQCKKKLILPLLIIAATFIGSVWMQWNIMELILVDGVIGFLFMRAVKYN